MPASAKEREIELKPVFEEGQNADRSGSIVFCGDVSNQKTDQDGYEVFRLAEETFSLSWSPGSISSEQEDEEWKLHDSGIKDFQNDKIQLNEKIGKGLLLVETSFDQNKWVPAFIEEGLYGSGDETEIENPFYTAPKVQVDNGCWYRVSEVFETRKKLDKKKLLVFDEYEYEVNSVVWEFYVKGADSNLSIDNQPRKVSSSFTKMELDSGYSKEARINPDDPHYGWKLGEFVLNGYTSDAKSDSNQPVFLKNAGDEIVLWFRLNQDIDKLNGKENLSICSDTNGYNQTLQTKKSDYGKGVLHIVQTDYENRNFDPVTYTNFLEACTTPGADTRIQLFEEGDYLVLLDYEIEDSGSKIPGKKDHSNYQMRYEFSIRNGNCMVFPFDLETGKELKDQESTDNGFRLDLAKSRNLNISVVKSDVTVDRKGAVKEDVRFSKPAKDGSFYTDPGKYVFKVSNPYTGESTTKTIYVKLAPDVVKKLRQTS